MKFAWLLVVLLCGAAQAAHITDKLVVGLYDKPALQGEPLQLLTSGTPIEVLERAKDAVKVRLADDTRGWIEAGYVSEEKPARMMLLEAQAELRQLKQQAASAQPGEEQNGKAVGRETELQQQLEAAQQRIARLQQCQSELLAARLSQQKLESLRERVDRAVTLLADGRNQPLNAAAEDQGVVERYLPWIAAGVALVLGFIAGVGFIDYRIRKRYGGFRI